VDPHFLTKHLLEAGGLGEEEDFFFGLSVLAREAGKAKLPTPHPNGGGLENVAAIGMCSCLRL
jgi:hypothetical protein